MSTIDRGWSPVPAWRVYTNGLVFAACILLALLALERLARTLLINHLDRTAGEVLGALIHADTPHHWSARIGTEIVANQAFGTADYAFESNGFRVRSRGEPIEIGLAIPSPIDLRRYSNLQVDIASESVGTLAVVIRSTLDSDACNSESIELQPDLSTVSVDLRRVQWTCAGIPAPAPVRAEMLRLRLNLAAGSALTLISVAARAHQALSADALDQLQLPLLPTLQDPQAFERALDRASAEAPGRLWPIVQLSTDARVEQILMARDLVEHRIADAIIVANGHFPEVVQVAHHWKPNPATAEPVRWSIWLAGVYALVLLWIRLKPPARPRLRALLELLGVTAVPVALIAGGAIGDDIDRPILAVGAITLAFALSLLVGSAPAKPGARTLKRGWWVALFSVALAVVAVLATTGGQLPGNIPHFSRALHYLIWAAVMQFTVCVIIAERIERIIGSALWAVLGAALLFALMTTPNAALMQLSFIGGLIWVWNWQRHRALLANILAHAVCALLLVTSLPPDWLYSGEVSARFLLNSP